MGANLDAFDCGAKSQQESLRRSVSPRVTSTVKHEQTRAASCLQLCIAAFKRRTRFYNAHLLRTPLGIFGPYENID
jgi:hypothetical protein